MVQIWGPPVVSDLRAAAAVLGLLALTCRGGSPPTLPATPAAEEAPPLAGVVRATLSPVPSATPHRPPTAGAAPPAPPTSADAPLCAPLRDDPAAGRRQLIAALEAYGSGGALAATAQELLAAAARGDELPDAVFYGRSGNTGLGIVALDPALTLPGDVPFAPRYAPREGHGGCWGFIRTGMTATREGSELVVTPTYALAFASDRGVATLAVPTYWDGIDGFNVLAVADLDGDGWQEGLYRATSGWVGQAHEQLAGEVTLLVTSRDGALRVLPPFDDVALQRKAWQLGDVNGDGRVDLTEYRDFPRAGYCAHDVDPQWGDPPTVRNPVTLAQGADGAFSYTNAEAVAILRNRCPASPVELHTAEDVLCARIWGACTRDVAQRVRATNRAWSCELERRGEPQRHAAANKEYRAMLEHAATYVPPATLAPPCPR